MTSKTEQPTFQEHLFLDATRVYYLLHVRGTKWCQKHFTVTMIDVESHLQARLTWNTLDCNGETSTVNKWQRLKMIRSCWWLNWSFKTLQQPQEFLILLRKLTLHVGSGWKSLSRTMKLRNCIRSWWRIYLMKFALPKIKRIFLSGNSFLFIDDFKGHTLMCSFTRALFNEITAFQLNCLWNNLNWQIK